MCQSRALVIKGQVPIRGHMQRYLSVLLGIFCVASLATGVVTANPAQPGTAENGLSENETAMLWSGDSDNYITQEEYYQQYGKERSTVAQVANGTDITFKRPPRLLKLGLETISTIRSRPIEHFRSSVSRTHHSTVVYSLRMLMRPYLSPPVDPSSPRFR